MCQQHQRLFAISKLDLLERVTEELEEMRSLSLHEGLVMPRACRALLVSLPGNSNCVDCGKAAPEWASVTYGTLLCVQCSGRHRSYGVQTSFVRSVTMDAWSQPQILAMLEGGNGQFRAFFDRHELGTPNVIDVRYKTKAAQFYRSKLQSHVQLVVASGLYRGREASRQLHERHHNHHHHHHNHHHPHHKATTSSSVSGISSTVLPVPPRGSMEHRNSPLLPTKLRAR